jgi:hypothetical protein
VIGHRAYDPIVNSPVESMTKDIKAFRSHASPGRCAGAEGAAQRHEPAHVHFEFMLMTHDTTQGRSDNSTSLGARIFLLTGHSTKKP